MNLNGITTKITNKKTAQDLVASERVTWNFVE